MQPLGNSHLQSYSKGKMPFTCDVYVRFKKYPATYMNIVFATSLVGLTAKLASQLTSTYRTVPICQTYTTATHTYSDILYCAATLWNILLRPAMSKRCLNVTCESQSHILVCSVLLLLSSLLSLTIRKLTGNKGSDKRWTIGTYEFFGTMLPNMTSSINGGGLILTPGKCLS